MPAPQIQRELTLPDKGRQYLRDPAFQQLDPQSQVYAMRQFMAENHHEFGVLTTDAQQRLASQFIEKNAPGIAEKAADIGEYLPVVGPAIEAGRRFEAGVAQRPLTAAFGDMLGVEVDSANKARWLAAGRDVLELGLGTALTAGVGGPLFRSAAGKLLPDAFESVAAKVGARAVSESGQALQETGKQAARRWITERGLARGMEDASSGVLLGATHALERKMGGEEQDPFQDFVATPAGVLALGLGFMGAGKLASRFGPKASLEAMKFRNTQDPSIVKEIDEQAGRVIDGLIYASGGKMNREAAAEMAFRAAQAPLEGEEADFIIKALKRSPDMMKSDLGLHILALHRDRVARPKMIIDETRDTLGVKADTMRAMGLKINGVEHQFAPGHTINLEFTESELRGLRPMVEDGSLIVDSAHGKQDLMAALGIGPEAGETGELFLKKPKGTVGPPQPLFPNKRGFPNTAFGRVVAGAPREAAAPGPEVGMPRAGGQLDFWPEQLRLFDDPGPQTMAFRQMEREMSKADEILDLENMVARLPLEPELSFQMLRSPDYQRAVTEVNSEIEEEALAARMDTHAKMGRKYKTKENAMRAAMKDMDPMTELNMTDADFDRRVLQKLGIEVTGDGQVLGPIDLMQLDAEGKLSPWRIEPKSRRAPSSTEIHDGTTPFELKVEKEMGQQLGFETYLMHKADLLIQEAAEANRIVKHQAGLAKRRVRDAGTRLKTKEARSYRSYLHETEPQPQPFVRPTSGTIPAPEPEVRTVLQRRGVAEGEDIRMVAPSGMGPTEPVMGRTSSFGELAPPAQGVWLPGRLKHPSVPSEPFAQTERNVSEAVQNRMTQNLLALPKGSSNITLRSGSGIGIAGGKVQRQGTVIVSPHEDPLGLATVSFEGPGRFTNSMMVRGRVNAEGELLVPDAVVQALSQPLAEVSTRESLEAAERARISALPIKQVLAEEPTPLTYPVGRISGKEPFEPSAKGASATWREDNTVGEILNIDHYIPRKDLTRMERQGRGTRNPSMNLKVIREDKFHTVVQQMLPDDKGVREVFTLSTEEVDRLIKAGKARFLTMSADKFSFEGMPVDKIPIDDLLLDAKKVLKLLEGMPKSDPRREKATTLAMYLQDVAVLRMRRIDAELSHDLPPLQRKGSGEVPLVPATRVEELPGAMQDLQNTEAKQARIPEEQRTTTPSSMGVKGCKKK